MLSVLSEYIRQIPELNVDGIYGAQTAQAVSAAQGYFGLPQTGTVDETTWDEIYDQFAGIENRTLRSGETFPPANLTNSPARQHYARSSTMTQFPGRDLQYGNQDAVRQEVVR
jgi:peptidoglycan hydrolase-like protein with peptidoglycan-binding domain